MSAHIGSLRPLATVFRARCPLYSRADGHESGVGRPRPRLVRRHQGPVGPKAAATARRAAPGRWAAATARGANRPRRGRRSGLGGANVSALDDLLRRSRARFGGGGGGGSSRPAEGSLILWASLGLVALWLVFTSTHSIAPGAARRRHAFGRYSRTLGPGVSLTLPVADRAGDEDRCRKNPDLRSRLREFR